MNIFINMNTFVTVVDALSFSEAARRLGATKSQVSQRIQQLEKHLGCTLVSRTRPISITDAGQVYYTQAVHLLQELKNSEQSVRRTDTSLQGRLCVSAPLAFTPRYLAPIFSKFAKKHPDLDIDVQSTDSFVSLQDQHFDMAIRIGRLEDSSLVARIITDNHHLICASPEYLEKNGTPQHPEDLQLHDGLMYYNREPNGFWRLPFNGHQESFRIRTRLRTDSGHQLLESAKAGIGLAILPTFLAQDALLCGELIPVLLPYSPSGGHISVVYRKAIKTPHKILALAQFLGDEIGHPAPWDRALAERGLLY
ncbi:LysR family transcriptional regulator [Pseudomonas sp. 22526]|uniref:LysR family transcriptional regulator n=1 Tax=Pseudomonas sp. 22526 TaxID=3453937 RepID=UPI003F87A713